MATNPVPPTPFKTPLIDEKTGLLTNPWTAWFREMFERVGGSSAPSSNLLALIENLQTDVDALDGGLNQGPNL